MILSLASIIKRRITVFSGKKNLNGEKRKQGKRNNLY